MKKLVTLFLALFASVAAFSFAGCDKGETPEGGKSGDVVLNVESIVFTVKCDYIELGETTSVKDYMDALKANGELVFDGSNSEFGFYIESVYGRKAEDDAFWAVYTDLVKIEGDDAVYSTTEWGSFTYGGKTLGSAAYGVSSLPCVEGYTYALVYETF
jgi:hypothetical protein